VPSETAAHAQQSGHPNLKCSMVSAGTLTCRTGTRKDGMNEHTERGHPRADVFSRQDRLYGDDAPRLRAHQSTGKPAIGDTAG